jgi:cytochrome c-type biogenesis protein CcmH/NrfF
MVKKKKALYNIWLLWFLPIAALGLAFILFQAL